MLNLVWRFRVSSSRWSLHNRSPQFSREYGPSAWGLRSSSCLGFSGWQIAGPGPRSPCLPGLSGRCALGSFGLCPPAGELARAEVAGVWFCLSLLPSLLSFPVLAGQWEVILIPEGFFLFHVQFLSCSSPCSRWLPLYRFSMCRYRGWDQNKQGRFSCLLGGSPLREREREMVLSDPGVQTEILPRRAESSSVERWWKNAFTSEQMYRIYRSPKSGGFGVLKPGEQRL